MKFGDIMLDKERVLSWCEIEYDLYEENGHIFGVELDLFNNHEYFYEKIIKEDGVESYQYLEGDVFDAIEQFNAILNKEVK
jgi:hypothetical protein